MPLKSSTLIAEALRANSWADLDLQIVSHPCLAVGPCSGIVSNRNIERLWSIANGSQPSALDAAILQLVGETLLLEELP